MNTRTIIAVALFGLTAAACQHDQTPSPTTAAGQSQYAQGRAVSPPEQTGQMGPLAEEDETTPAMPTSPSAPTMQVEPAVSIVAVDIECPNAAVFFPTESAQLGAEDKRVLDQIAACLKGTPGSERVQVSGFTDPRGTETYNEQLGQERARAVADYLREQGVDEDAFRIYARGEKGMVEGMPMLWPLQRTTIVEPID
ncbi:MAG: OmpA family protein [Myxococcota bacterium]